jgi:hypothetical protein
VKWPSGTVADKDVNSKSLSLKDNPAVHTVYSEKGRFEYTRCSVYRTWHDVHSKQYIKTEIKHTHNTSDVTL